MLKRNEFGLKWFEGGLSPPCLLAPMGARLVSYAARLPQEKKSRAVNFTFPTFHFSDFLGFFFCFWENIK